MIGRIVVCAGAAMLAVAPLRVEAHHSAVMFDDQKEVTLQGTVREFQYTNPHSWLLVDVIAKDGKVTTWGFEAEGPSSLTRAGIRLKDFTPGTAITITGHPMKDGRPAATWIRAFRDKDKRQFVPASGFAIR